jgi:feruloyl-CoA synthase
MCVNQAQIGDCLTFLRARPPKVLDWLPWNHVFGGSHNFNMMLAHGGSYYIDGGRPTKAGFAVTLQNLRDHAGTLAFNVPIGFSMLVSALRDDAPLRRRFFEDLDLIFYAAASLPKEIWQALEGFAREITGKIPLMTSSWGMTETAPAAIMAYEPIGRPGVIGVPLPGTRVKLIPDQDRRFELRFAGPNVMTGYFEDPEKTRESFDEEGYLISGDAVRFVDPANPSAGLMFDGRLAEDFKLMTGTWVRASILRLDALEAFGGLAADIVITGHDRNEIGVLVFPDLDALKAADIDTEDDRGALIGQGLSAALDTILAELAGRATGSSTLIARALVLAEPPSIRHQEITAKGSLNNRRILTGRAALVDRLYDDDDPALVRLQRS